MDCIAYNKETSASNYYDYWEDSKHSANTITVDETGTLIETDASQYSTTYMQAWLKAYPDYINAPLCFEMDVVDADNYIMCHHMRQQDDSMIWSSTSLSTGLWKIFVTSNKLEVYKDGVLQKSQTTDTKSARPYLQSTQARGNGFIKFKTFRCYPV